MIFKYLIKLTFLTVIFFNFTVVCQQPANFQLSPEEIESLKNNPFGPLSDQEINEFLKFINELSPEELSELEKLGESIMKEMETAEKKEEPITETQTEEPSVKIETPKIVRPAFEEKNKIEAQKIIKAIIKYLREIRQEAVKDEAVSRRLKIWEKDLNDLTYFLHVLDKNELLEHLASKEFSKLYSDLKKFKENLEDNLSSFKVKEVISEEESDDPYEILGVNRDATQKEIESAFKKLKSERDPKILEKRLKNADLSDKEISQKLKETKLSFSLIETAYESLKNPKIRAQIDSELKKTQSPYQQVKEVSKTAFSKILAAFSTVFYDNAVLNQIQKLLEKYEPQALEKKKEIEKAQEDAKKAQAELSKKRVTPSVGSSYGSYSGDRPWPSPSSSSRFSGSPSSPFFQDFGGDRPSESGFGPDKKPEKREVGTISRKDEKKADDSKDAGAAPSEGLGKSEKEDKDRIIELMKDLDEKHLSNLYREITNSDSTYNKIVSVPYNDAKLQDYVHQAQQFKKNMQLDQIIEKTGKLAKELDKIKDRKKLAEYKKEFESKIYPKNKASLAQKINIQLPKFKSKLTEAPEAKHHPVGLFGQEFSQIYNNLERLRKIFKDETDVAKDILKLNNILQNVADVNAIDSNQEQITNLINETKDFINNKAGDEQKELLAPVWKDKILNLDNFKAVRNILEDPKITKLKKELEEITESLNLKFPEAEPEEEAEAEMETPEVIDEKSPKK